jgi:hypothetical protein
MAIIRSMIEGVDLLPRTNANALDAVLHGDLVAILAACGALKQRTPRTFRPMGVNYRWLRGCAATLNRTIVNQGEQKAPLEAKELIGGEQRPRYPEGP